MIGIAGSGGDGVVSAGEALANMAARTGYHAIVTKSFGSQIRGGESSCRVRLSTRVLHTPAGALDVAVVLDWDDYARLASELPIDENTLVVYEAASKTAADKIPLAVKPTDLFAIPFAAIAKEATGDDQAKNAVILGMLAGWLDLPADALVAALRARLGKKANVEAIAKGFAAGGKYAAEKPLRVSRTLERPTEAKVRNLADGNQMCAAGAIFAGCRFFGGYPITPATEVMQVLQRDLPKYGGTVLQCEDEIAGIGAAIGASFAGDKAMTATSGPGMSLKSEMMGLATIAELPLVIMNVQRGGPATGLPTKSEQADLFQAVFSAHGDAPRPVLAVTSVADTFLTTIEAFNIAEALQTPTIVLSDQEIAQRKETFDAIDTSRIELVERLCPKPEDLTAGYDRFAITESGISPITHPGMEGGSYLAGGIEHDPHGNPTNSGQMHARMMDKRQRKLARLADRKDLFSVHGDAAAPIAMVAWGSVAGIAREAIERCEVEGIRAKLLVPRLLFPVAEAVYAAFFASVRAGFVVEQNHQGQLYRLLRMYLEVPRGLRSLARSGANPFGPAELVAELAAAAKRMEV